MIGLKKLSFEYFVKLNIFFVSQNFPFPAPAKNSIIGLRGRHEFFHIQSPRPKMFQSRAKKSAFKQKEKKNHIEFSGLNHLETSPLEMSSEY